MDSFVAFDFSAGFDLSPLKTAAHFNSEYNLAESILQVFLCLAWNDSLLRRCQAVSVRNAQVVIYAACE